MSDAPPPAPGAGLSVLVKQIEAALRARLQPVLAEVDLGMDHWRMMAVLQDSPGIGMTALAHIAVVPAATLTRHMDRLVERGMIVRRIDPADKRRAVVALSPRGARLAARIGAEERAVEAELARGLGEQRFRDLTRDLGLVPRAIS